jgi:2-keto-3-deoxy-L-rhamnonate aldolase RhmA
MTIDLKSRLRQRQPVFGSWTSIGHPSITEAFCRAPFDFTGIDLEHSTISQEQAQRIIAASQAAHIPCLPRIASHNAEQIKQLLDSGADGIIVPMVNTLDEVKRLVDWSKYPPVGKRSFGVSRAQGYGFDFDRYTAGWNKRSVLLLQIESAVGVQAIDELVSHESVDGVMVGPYDLSGTLGIPGQLDHPRVQEACAQVIAACRKHGKACGTQLVDPTEAGIQETFERGYTFIILSSDVFLLWKWSERMQSLMTQGRKATVA